VVRAGVLPVSFALALLAGCGADAAPRSPEPPPPPLEVRVAPATKGPVRRTLQVTGSLVADEESTVAAKVTGRIVATLADLGDRVREGAPLARVDPTDLSLERDEKQRIVEERLLSLGLTAMPGPDFDVETLLEVTRARLRAELAKSLHERAAKLGDIVPAEEADRLRSDAQVADYEHRLAAQQAGARLAAARTAKAQLELAEQRLRDTLHVAPTPPRDPAEGGGGATYAVAERFVAVGDHVAPGAPLFRLLVDDPLRFRARVPERRAGSVRGGLPVSVRVDGVEGTFAGEVGRLAPAIDRETRTLLVEVVVRNGERRLRPGGFARAEIELGEESVVLVPRAALSTFAGVEKVFVVEGDKARERLVRTGLAAGELLEIAEGLEPGEPCILDPPPTLFGGSPVKVNGEGRGEGGPADAGAR